MTGVYISDEADKAFVSNVLFDRLYWDRLDLGTISDEETLEKCHERLPSRLWDICDKIYYDWVYNIPVIEGMDKLLPYLKERYGVRLFLISNISKYFVSHKEDIPILKEFEYCVFSSDLGVCKPSPIIFDHLLRTCSLERSESIFIDDNKSNIEGAIGFGLHGYLFDGDAERLKSYLDKLLSE